MKNIYIIIESYVDIDGSTVPTYLGYVDNESEAYKIVFGLRENLKSWKNQAEASCTSYYYQEVEPYKGE